MSLHSYKQSQALIAIDPAFSALIMAARRKADSMNALILDVAFPEITSELDLEHKE